MTPDKIYVLMIDGADVWVPINARHITANQYQLLLDPQYDELDKAELIQFFPGDIVETETETFFDGSTGLVARQLIKAAHKADRDYLEFQYYATRNSLRLDKETAIKYQDTIKRIIKEINSEEFFYPNIVNIVTKLSGFLSDSKTIS